MRPISHTETVWTTSTVSPMYLHTLLTSPWDMAAPIASLMVESLPWWPWAWLNWQLKGDQEAAKLFKNGELKNRKDWTLETNGK